MQGKIPRSIHFDQICASDGFIDFEAAIGSVALRLSWYEKTQRWDLTAFDMDSGVDIPCGEPTVEEMKGN